MRRLVLLLTLVAGPVAGAAEQVVSPTEFERMSAGATLYFDRGGLPFGAETYMANRQVVWRYADGTCAAGHWFARGDDICFVYDNNPAPQCWVFVARAGDFFARIVGTPSGDASEIRLAGESPQPLRCPAPNLGV